MDGSIRIGEFRLQKDLLYGPAGPMPSVTDSQIHVLRYLGQCQLSGKKEWQSVEQIAEGANVSATSVANCITALKKIIGENSISNKKNHGYRLELTASLEQPRTGGPVSSLSDRSSGYIKVPRGGAPGSPSVHPEDMAVPTDAFWAEKTYLAYRDIKVPALESTDCIRLLERHYHCEAISLAGRRFGAATIWQNDDRLIWPDEILGELDTHVPTPLRRSGTLNETEYAEARIFTKRMFELGPIKHESRNYRMTSIDMRSDPPKINGAIGYYYDNILTQFSMEWELKKAIVANGGSGITELPVAGTLPLREAAERLGNPLTSGAGRCAALSVSTFLVFQRGRPMDEFYCLLRKRSLDTGVHPGYLHVLPSAMFEATNQERWSIELNVWRELLEEVYDEKALQGTEIPNEQDPVRRRPPINLLLQMIDRGSAEFTVTGIFCDLFNVRPEISTLIFIRDPEFFESREMVFNWEYEPRSWQGIMAGRGPIPLSKVPDVIAEATSSGGVTVGAAACIKLGLQWLRRRHGIG